MNKFEKKIEIRWSDIDQNNHVRHSAYYDFGAYARIQCFVEAGFGMKEMEAQSIGPILFKEECSFIREIKPEDQIRINMKKGDIRKDGSRWVIHHELFNQDDEKVAHITVHGAWMDTKLRKLKSPSAELALAFDDLPVGNYYRRD